MDSTMQCLCCLLRPSVRDLQTPYSRLGITETYSLMIQECFAMQLTLCKDGKSGICMGCVEQLREACRFKLQIHECQAKLQAMLEQELKLKDEEVILLSEDDSCDRLSLSEEASTLPEVGKGNNESTATTPPHALLEVKQELPCEVSREHKVRECRVQLERLSAALLAGHTRGAEDRGRATPADAAGAEREHRDTALGNVGGDDGGDEALVPPEVGKCAEPTATTKYNVLSEHNYSKNGENDDTTVQDPAKLRDILDEDVSIKSDMDEDRTDDMTFDDEEDVANISENRAIGVTSGVDEDRWAVLKSEVDAPTAISDRGENRTADDPRNLTRINSLDGASEANTVTYPATSHHELFQSYPATSHHELIQSYPPTSHHEPFQTYPATSLHEPIQSYPATSHHEPIQSYPPTSHHKPFQTYPATSLHEPIQSYPATSHHEPIQSYPPTSHHEPFQTYPATSIHEPIQSYPATSHHEPIQSYPPTSHHEPFQTYPATALHEPIQLYPATSHHEPIQLHPATSQHELRRTSSLEDMLAAAYAEELMHPCDWCGEQFIFKKDLKQHSQTHTVSKYKCEICNMKFTSANSLGNHNARNHLPYKCNKCVKRFSTKTCLQTHETKCEGTLYICRQCFRQFRSKKFLYFHRKHHHPLPYSCHECNREFVEQGHLDSHMISHDTQKPNICLKCKILFPSKLELNKHKIKSHKAKKLYKCNKCIKRFSTTNRRQTHERTCEGTFYTCKQCDRQFRGLKSLYFHKKHHHPLPYSCHECNREFVEQGHLNSHMISHDTEKPNICIKCKILFPSKLELNKHKIKSHKAKKLYKCNKCMKRFSTTNRRQTHERTCEGRLYICKQCDKQFIGRKSFDFHKNRHHPQSYICNECNRHFIGKHSLIGHMRTHYREKPNILLCTQCKILFPTKHELEKHKRISHKVEKLYKCNKCVKRFSTTNRRQTHEKKCEGTTPFICKQCNKQFIGRKSFDFHKKNRCPKLIQEKQLYSCQECNQRFCEQYDLDIHMQTHIAEKPHICKQCKNQFKSEPELARHERIHSGDKSYECEICESVFFDEISLTKHLETHRAKKQSNLCNTSGPPRLRTGRYVLYI